MKNMKKLLEKIQNEWLNLEIKVLDWLLLQTFLLSSEEKQKEIIDNHVKEFFENNEIAKQINNDGDFVSALYYSSIAMDSLGKVVVYCNKKGIDVKKLLDEYQKENNKF